MTTVPEALAMAMAHHQAGQLEAAAQIYRQILQVEPSQADALHLLGMAAHQLGRSDEALDYILRALAVRGDIAEFHSNLGKIYHDLRRAPEAVACFRRAIELKPELLAAHNNLGSVFREQGKVADAAACFSRALELNPNHGETCNNLGLMRMEQGNLDDAIVLFRRALELKPDFARAHNNLGNALKEEGLLDDAIASYRRAMALAPHDSGMHSNLINTLHHHPRCTADAVREELGRWSRQFAEPGRDETQPYANERDPERCLRVGYVSPDFRDHIIGRCLRPVLEQHDRRRFQVYCYASVTRADALTQWFQQTAEEWRDISTASNQAAADLIRADRIDILVDLNLHTAGSRLLVFWNKPAPVQVCWLGYPGTTGLATIDYRLTDPYLDPPDARQEPWAEEPIWLPHSFLCYDPPEEAPPVNPVPALAASRITFGSLNHFSKMNNGVVALWSRVLGVVSESRLLISSKRGAHRERALKEFERHGVAADRIEWHTPGSRAAYLAAYHRIDVGLDPFPYNGHTTSLDAAWMGVPVVTLVGNRGVGRAGLSVAMNLGLPELAASSPEQYVQIAAELARDLPRVGGLRATLRGRVRASPLMDGPRFARDLETAYRTMWKRWCATKDR